MKKIDIKKIQMYIDKDIKVVKNNGVIIEGMLRTLDVGPTLFIRERKGNGITVHITDIKEVFEI